MGRIKTRYIKRVTHALMRRYGTMLTDDFEGNQKIVDRLVDTPSRKLRNVIAGYAVRLVKERRGMRGPVPDGPSMPGNETDFLITGRRRHTPPSAGIDHAEHEALEVGP